STMCRASVDHSWNRATLVMRSMRCTNTHAAAPPARPSSAPLAARRTSRRVGVPMIIVARQYRDAMDRPQRGLSDGDLRRLLAFRDGLRRFLHWSTQQAEAVGLTGTQHQLLLAIRGHGEPPPSIRDVADHLLLRHHSAVELVDRAEKAGLVRRENDPDDQREIGRAHV